MRDKEKRLIFSTGGSCCKLAYKREDEEETKASPKFFVVFFLNPFVHFLLPCLMFSDLRRTQDKRNGVKFEVFVQVQHYYFFLVIALLLIIFASTSKATLNEITEN